MQQVGAEWQEVPAPTPFEPGEHDDHAECYDHKIDPWLREPLEFAPDTGVPLGHLGVSMKNDIVNQIQDERHRGVEPTPLLIIRDELLQRAAVEGIPSLAYPAQQYLELLGGELNAIPTEW